VIYQSPEQPVGHPPSYQPHILPPTQDSMMHYPEPMFNVPIEAPSTMLPPPPLAKAEPSLMDGPPNFASGSTVPMLGSNPATTPPRQRAVRTNWFHPTRWSTINAAGLRANFSSAHEIVRLAKLAPGGEDIFKTLDRGTVHKWIDKERGCWSESVLDKVRKAAVKEAESWDAGRDGEEGGEIMQGVGMSVFGPPGMEGPPPELVGASGGMGPFHGNVDVGEHTSIGNS
jgi:hypothetical protein